MPSDEAIHLTVERYLDRFSADDREGWLALWAPDATMEDPVGSPTKTSLDEIGAFFDESRSMADSLRLVATGPVLVAAGEAAFPMQARPVIGGTEFVVDIIDTMAFTDGPDGEALIHRMRAFWDPSTMRPVE